MFLSLHQFDHSSHEIVEEVLGKLFKDSKAFQIHLERYEFAQTKRLLIGFQMSQKDAGFELSSTKWLLNRRQTSWQVVETCQTT